MGLSAVHRYKIRELLFIIIYWVISVRLFVVLDSTSFSSNPINDPKVFQILRTNLTAGFAAALAIGLLTGLSELYFFQRYFRNQPIYRLLLTKSLVYFTSIIIIGFFTLFGYNLITHDPGFTEAFQFSVNLFKSGVFYRIMLVGAILSLGINFLLITKNKIGHSIFMPILLGKYHRPKDEERIFLFIDLKSSTSIAERLGHKKYSRLLQDCFNDLANLVIKHRGSIYQFVGDESVVTWKARRTKNYHECVNLFFEFQEYLFSRSDYYIQQYQLVPVFKGSANAGHVMVAEVGGTVKSEIAYHGDVLNAAARMMELCNLYQKDLVISEKIFKHLPNKVEGIQIDHQGEFQLRGKDQKLLVYSATSKNLKHKLL